MTGASEQSVRRGLKFPKFLEARTMLFTVEHFDPVTSFVVLTEDSLLLGLVKGGLVVPRRSGFGVGSTVANFALQNVDCTRNV